MKTLFDRARAASDELNFWNLIPRDDCLRIMSGHQPVTLIIARRVAFRLGMNLTDLLAGTVESRAELLDATWVAQLTKEMRPKRRNRTHNRDEVHKKILSLLSDHKKGNPPPLRFITKELGVSTGYLHYHFPVLASKITDAHKVWKHEQQIQKRKRAREVALKCITDEFGISKKAVLRMLREETGLPKNMLREEINVVFELIVQK